MASTHDILPIPLKPGVTQPAIPTPVCEIVEALRSITPLEGLTHAEYTWLAEHGTEQMAQPGAVIFLENERVEHLNFILKGEIHVHRRNSGPLALFIGRSGQMTGKLPYSRMKTYGGDSTAVGHVWGLNIHESQFPAMLQAIPSMAQRSVSVLLDRVREVTRMEQQAEKLSALGKLAANLAHELNNPASAAQRSAASLFGELRLYGDHRYTMGSLCLGPEYSELLRAWVQKTRETLDQLNAQLNASNATPLSPLDQTDREEAILRWLTANNVEDAWNIAPTLAETRVPLSFLDEFAAVFPQEVIAPAFRSFASALRVERITETILHSTARIFDLISAIKDYSYMDQAPIQTFDLAQSLGTTLAMFASRLTGIRVETNFDPELPPINAYGSELNQVWTALFENALDAMPNGGTLSLTTKLAGRMAFAEITDTGHGIDPSIQSRIFEPFFTTKAPGSGLGLGLDTAKRIVNRHSGFLTVESRPGRTCFQVRLPLEQAEAY
jgi:signal transduction histidine kinase